MACCSFSAVFMSGNFNVRAAHPFGSVPSDPEKVTSCELGFKSTVWNRRARFNVTAFHSNYDAIQQVITNEQAIQTIVNAASATIQGVEVEASVRPVTGLQLDAAFGYTDAEYDEFLGLDLTGDRVPDPEIGRGSGRERGCQYG